MSISMLHMAVHDRIMAGRIIFKTMILPLMIVSEP